MAEIETDIRNKKKAWKEYLTRKRLEGYEKCEEK